MSPCLGHSTLALAALVLTLASLPAAVPAQTPTSTSTSTSSPSPSPSPSASRSPSRSESPTPSPSPTSTAAPTTTPVPTAVLPDRPLATSYRGSWSSGSAAGALSLSWSQTGETLDGVAVFQNHPCLELAQVSARLSGDTVTATLRSSTSPALGSARLTAGGPQLAGTFTFSAGCDRSVSGLISLSAQSVVTPRGTPTATPTRPAQTATPTATASTTPTPRLIGDCNGDGAVVVNEILTLVSMGISTRPLSACRDGDRNGDGEITVDEIIAAVRAALNGRLDPPPPPIGDDCLDADLAGCICQASVCCLSGACGPGDPCRDAGDCLLPLVCETGRDGLRRCVEDDPIIVPPPR